MTLARFLRFPAAAALALATAACAPCPIPQTQPAPASVFLEPSGVQAKDTQVVVDTDTPRVVEVQIRTTQEGASGQFAPDEIRVRRGDLVRFQLADGDAIHYVSFTHLQPDRPGVPFPADSPMLLRSGQSWQPRIDLPPGTYEFVCIVHVMVGMRGTLTVEP